MQPVIFGVIIYFGMGLDSSAEKFFRFVAFLALLVMCGQSYGLFLGTLFKNVETATVVAPVAMMPMILFGGFMSNLTTIGDWI